MPIKFISLQLNLSVTQVIHVVMEARVGSMTWMDIDVTVTGDGLGNTVTVSSVNSSFIGLFICVLVCVLVCAVNRI